MNQETTYRPFETWSTETLQEEIKDMQKFARPAPQMIKNMERMQNELKRRNA